MPSDLTNSKEQLVNSLRVFLSDESAAISQAGSREWEHRPAEPEEFIEHALFLNNGANEEYWPVVKQDFTDFYKSGKREGCFCEAIGSGKSYKGGIIAAYEAHRLLCLKNPAKTLGLSSDSKLTIMNMGTRAMQARKVVFSKIKGRIDSCLWFQLLYPYDRKITSELRFPKNIYIVPGNSKETFPLGYDLVCAILDEADFYVDNEDRPVADEIHHAMRMRLESRIGTRWPWKLLSLSSPVYEDGFIERKMSESLDDGAEVFGRRRAIWDAKPWQYPGDRAGWMHAGTTYNVPAMLLHEARKNPIKFLRDRCAVSVTSLSPYFTDHEAITRAVNNGAMRCRFQQNGAFPTMLPGPHTYFIHIDLAKSRDSCGFALGHSEKMPGGASSIGIIDLLWRITPESGTEVNFAAVRQAVLQLRRMGFRIGKVSYDGWQSVDSVQQLTSKGIECEELSVDRTLEPYDTFLEAINEGRALLPACPPLTHAPHGILVREMKSLELIKGAKVDHPKGGSKDCSDACAGVFYHMQSIAPVAPQAVLIHKLSTGGKSYPQSSRRSRGPRGGYGTGGKNRYGGGRF